MKTASMFVLFVIGSLIQLRADPFSGSDNFNSPSVNSANWNTNPTVGGNPINDGLGSLQQTGGVVQYTANSGSGSDTQVWLWNVGTASLSSNWTVQMDISNQVISSAVTNSGAAIGIGVADTNNLLGDNLTLKLANTHGVQEFSSKAIEGGNLDGQFTAATSSTLASLQLSYNVSTQLITVGYDPIAGTNTFTTLNTFDPNSTWSMGTSDSFTFFIQANSDSIPVLSSNQVYGDNFSVQATPEPSATSLLMMGVGILVVVMSLKDRIKIRN